MKPILAFLLTASVLQAQGLLAPDGAPAPTMKTLAQIEARTAIPASSITAPVAGPHYTITQPGSYYLTGNITVTSGDGIQINASNVTLDLNGFALISTAVVNPVAGNAIFLGVGVSGIEIKNGRITGGTVRTFTGPQPWQATFARAGWFRGITDDPATPARSVQLSHLTVGRVASSGILLNGSCITVDHITAFSNGGYGIFVSGSVTNCSANGNDGIGISSYQGIIAHATSTDNTDHGISAYRGAVTNSSALSNGGIGISATEGSVTNSRGTANFLNGIYAWSGVASHCVATGNDISGGILDKQIEVINGVGQRDACVPISE